ncbi:MAG TPA: hypothetical protein VHN99_02805 [Deinococcales bacterium]|nr:hypothetical protein [Deinococcales bacterium]
MVVRRAWWTVGLLAALAAPVSAQSAGLDVFLRAPEFDFGAVSAGPSASAAWTACGPASAAAYTAFLRENTLVCDFGPTTLDPWPLGTAQDVVGGAAGLASDSLVRVSLPGSWALSAALAEALPANVQAALVLRSPSGEARPVALPAAGGVVVWAGTGALDLGLSVIVVLTRGDGQPPSGPVNARLRLTLNPR